ncbi:hypothetical protein VCR3J2_120105 [Vibrio coralliirubri]|nr:hypothetical protein VCR6J2_270019 [Vibrio coralliirubri]CDT77908.1 hypothetical protein VCR3J2_120105 [Vibrio coralliirubri]
MLILTMKKPARVAGMVNNHDCQRQIGNNHQSNIEYHFTVAL